MTARWHLPSPAVVGAVKATEPCPECWPDGADGKRRPHLNAAGNRAPCPTCDDRNDTRSPLVGGWLTLPWPVQPGDELRMVVEQWRMLHLGGYCGDHPSEWVPVEDGDPEADDENFERRQAWFATVTAGEVLPPNFGSGYAVRVASVVLHDPPRTTVECEACEGCGSHFRYIGEGDSEELTCQRCGGSGSVPLSVTDGEVAA